MRVSFSEDFKDQFSYRCDSLASDLEGQSHKIFTMDPSYFILWAQMKEFSQMKLCSIV